MAKMSCFPALLLSAGRRKKHRKVADAGKVGYNTDCPKVKPVEFTHASIVAEPRDAKDAAAADDGAVLKGGEQIDEKASVKKGDDDVSSDFEFECHAAKTSVGSDNGGAEKGDAGTAPEQEDTTLDASPRLKRSCSNIETKRPGPRVDDDYATPVVLPARSFSYSDLTDLPVATAGEERAIALEPAAAASPAASAKTSRSADRVMLKKRSSSQVLPSRSRKLWWRLFLWSHRNLHRARSASARPSAAAAAAAASCPPGRHGGYTSDTHEEDRKNKKVMVDGSPPPPPHPPVPNQWVAFCADNSLRDRVSAWVSSIENEPLPFRRIAEEEDDERYDADADDVEGHGERPRALLELGESSAVKGHNGKSKRSAAADEVNQANSVVQSLNAFSTVAHICGMGLKVVPMIAPFSSLRAVNLSNNFIVHISPGSLPKGLHSLDLSRNKITAIEGLRELTKLRVLNLSYNRISRIGHGLSNCTAIKELYLAGNKISDVEGLHRLLKLAVLDLSFNKITTAKALGQLVANYHSLLALNLVGNPVQANFGDDALRRAVTGLLPHLTYLNKQPVKPQRSAREAATDSVARAALGGGGGGRSQRRRAARRLGTGSGEGSVRSRSKGRHHGSGSTKK